MVPWGGGVGWVLKSSMNSRQTYHFTLTVRRGSAGSGGLGRHRYPKATPIWHKRGYASATTGNSHTSRRPHAKLVLEGVWGAKVVTPFFTKTVVHILVVLAVTTRRIWATPPIIITYIEDKPTYMFAIKSYNSKGPALLTFHSISPWSS